MKKTFGIGILFAVSSLFVAQGQSTDATVEGSYAGPSSQMAAPVVRGQGGMAGVQVFDLEPASGVSVRSDVQNGVVTVSSTGAGTELRVVQGRADITVHHPENHSQILVDLPNGQVSLLKDGLYTFNAGTNTVRVLRGEAEAYHNAADAAKGTKVKETQQVAFFGDAKPKAVNAYRYELTADLLAGGGGNHGDGGVRYGDGFYGGYPYYAYGYPYGYGFGPYGYGYPFGVGVGFGYYGGFGGFRGGFRR